MPDNVERSILQIDGDADGGLNAIDRIQNAWDELGRTLDSGAVDEAADGFEQLEGAAGDAGGEAKQGSGVFAALGSVVAGLNPASIAAGLGLLKLWDTLKNLKGEIIAVVGQAQTLEINLRALAAREYVKAGVFEDATKAMDTAKVAAAGLLDQIQKIGLESPYENSMVVQTFRTAMGFGYAADQAMTLTRSMLDLAAGMGKSGYEMIRLIYNLGQIKSIGKITGRELRDFSTAGMDLNDILQSQLNMSVDEFNAGLQNGTVEMSELVGAISQYTKTNFAGAAKDMAQTLTGLQSSIQDLKEVVYTSAIKPFFDEITAGAAKAFDAVAKFVTESGVLEKIGARLATVGKSLVSTAETIIEKVNSAFKSLSVEGDHLRLIFKDLKYWSGVFSGEIQKIWNVVARFFAPAVAKVRSEINKLLNTVDFGALPRHLRTAINLVLSLVSSLLTGIYNLLIGTDDAFAPLENSLKNVLAFMLLMWRNYLRNVADWGYSLVVQIARGIVQAARSVLSKAMQYVGQIIGLFIKPGSPPKKGPLSQIAEWGRGVMDVFVQSFKTADFSVLSEAVSPIRAALKSAFQAGDISQAGYLKAFKVARKGVAELISVYRKTGEISEEVLSKISDGLGEGGEDLVEYIRLQLKHRKALEHLESVQSEVAEAQKAGFVSSELKDRLKTAQEEAERAEDKVKWQQEYLSLQQEGVSVQLQLVKAVEDVGKKMSDAAKEAAAAGAAGAAAAMREMDFSTTLPMPDDMGGGLGIDKFDPSEELEDVQGAFDGISTEIGDARKEVEDWLALPIQEKVWSVLGEDAKQAYQEFEKMSWSERFGFLRVKITQGFNDLKAALKRVDWQATFEWVKTQLALAFDFIKKEIAKVDWAAVLESIKSGLGTAFDFIKERFSEIDWKNVFETVKDSVGDALGGIIENLNLDSKAGALKEKAIKWFRNLPNVLINFVKNNYKRWGLRLAYGFGRAVGAFFTFLTVTIPRWNSKLKEFWRDLRKRFVEWLINDAPTLALKLAVGLLIAIYRLWKFLEEKIPIWTADLIEFGGQLIGEFVAGFVKDAPKWMLNLIAVGKDVVEKIRQGIETIWNLPTFIKNKINAFVARVVIKAAIWVYKLRQVGKAIVQRIKEGVNKVWDFFQWIREKFLGFVSKVLAKVADWLSDLAQVGPKLVQKIKDGINKAWDLLPWMKTKLVNWWVSLLDGKDAEWIVNVFNAGKAIVENLKAGIIEKWDDFKRWLIRKLGGVVDWFPGSEPKEKRSPLYGLGKRGEAFVENFAEGIDFQAIEQKVRSGLAGVAEGLNVNAPIQGQINALRPALQGAAAPQMSVQQNFGDLVFPNVRNGDDALDIREKIDRMALEAFMRKRSSG